jgi:hypothetical protein
MGIAGNFRPALEVRGGRSFFYVGTMCSIFLLAGADQVRRTAPPGDSASGIRQVAANLPEPPPVTFGRLDLPLQLINAARMSYRGINDYTCLFVKREALRGQLQPENLIDMRIRTQPFSVYLRWLTPTAHAGQEACYVAGRNGGMLRAHSKGLLGIAGFVSLDPRDPRALQDSRHVITEAGIGNLIERYGQAWERESRMNRTVVQVADYAYNNRRCTRVEVAHPDNADRQFQFYRSVVYFDQEHHLPIRVENYDAPRSPAERDGVLAECYSYADLHLNVGVAEATFNH